MTVHDASGTVEVSSKEPIWASAQRPVLASDWMSDGNGYALLGHAQKAQRDADWTLDQRTAWMAMATEGDYDHLLRAIVQWHDMPDDDDDEDY